MLINIITIIILLLLFSVEQCFRHAAEQKVTLVLKNAFLSQKTEKDLNHQMPSSRSHIGLFSISASICRGWCILGQRYLLYILDLHKSGVILYGKVRYKQTFVNRVLDICASCSELRALESFTRKECIPFSETIFLIC